MVVWINACHVCSTNSVCSCRRSAHTTVPAPAGGNEDGDTIDVHDPGFDTANYSYADDIVGFRVFDMS